MPLAIVVVAVELALSPPVIVNLLEKVDEAEDIKPLSNKILVVVALPFVLGVQEKTSFPLKVVQSADARHPAALPLATVQSIAKAPPIAERPAVTVIPLVPDTVPVAIPP